VMPAPKIVTEYWAKPGPSRQFDWCATIDGDEPNDNGHMAQGYGRTEAEAIADLVNNYLTEDA
jgi:hypothetical protein